MRALAETTDTPRMPELLAAISFRAGGQVSSEQLTGLLHQIHSATQAARKLVHGRNPAELTMRLEPGSWSVAECLDHLAQTTRAFLPAISDAIATAPGLTTNRTLRTGTLARLFIRNLEPPYRLRFKVLPQIAPQNQDFEAAWNSFVEAQSELLETVRSAAGLAIDKVRIKSPVYARISYNVYGAFGILVAHERRHLWQIDKILKSVDLRETPEDAA